MFKHADKPQLMFLEEAKTSVCVHFLWVIKESSSYRFWNTEYSATNKNNF